jgi:hypothetical protein
MMVAPSTECAEPSCAATTAGEATDRRVPSIGEVSVPRRGAFSMPSDSSAWSAITVAGLSSKSVRSS